MINPFKMQEMLSQASQMQEEVQRKLAQTVVEGSSGGGAVTAAMNGKKQLLRIKIDPAAVNDAGRKAEEALQGQLKGILGGLNLPGLG